MGAKIAARDAQQFGRAKAALRELSKAGEKGVTGKGLLGDLYRGRWGDGFMHRVVKYGAASMRDGTQMRGPYSAKLFFPTETLEELLDDDEAIGGLLWPGSAVSIGGDDEDEDEAASDEPPESEEFADEEPDLGQAAVAVQQELAAARDPDAFLEAMVKLSAVLVQNIVSFREQLTQVQEDIAAIRRQWE